MNVYFNTYEFFITRLSYFVSGRYYIKLISSLIPQGTEKCFVSSAREGDNPVTFIVANDEKIISGFIDWFSDEKIEVSFTSYNKKCITSCSVTLSNPNPKQLNEYTRLKEMLVSINFQDGTTLLLNSHDYSPEETSFSEAIPFLLQ